jgi:hypothetical protein
MRPRVRWRVPSEETWVVGPPSEELICLSAMKLRNPLCGEGALSLRERSSLIWARLHPRAAPPRPFPISIACTRVEASVDRARLVKTPGRDAVGLQVVGSLKGPAAGACGHPRHKKSGSTRIRRRWTSRCGTTDCRRGGSGITI